MVGGATEKFSVVQQQPFRRVFSAGKLPAFTVSMPKVFIYDGYSSEALEIPNPFIVAAFVSELLNYTLPR